MLNLYEVYELSNWSRNPSYGFALKNCLFGTVKLTRDTIKNKITNNVREITYDEAGSWS